MREQIQSLLTEFSFDQVSALPLTTPVSMSFYQSWLDEGLNAQMSYLRDHLETKKDLKHILPDAQSTIVVTESYFHHPEPHESLKDVNQAFHIAKYAQGIDYHYWFKNKLQQACEKLKSAFPEHHFLPATDSQPIMERDFAYQAGLGWFGKNTCVIHSNKGSFFLIGEIITSLPLSSTLPDITVLHPDRCGKCTKCIEACPTEALSADSDSHTKTKLDASKCISYWTIEAKTTPPLALAKKFGTWFFGCDICQDVCPWNQKVFEYKHQPVSPPSAQWSREHSLKTILEILNSSHKSLEKKFAGTPLTRPRGFGLKRNALIMALNLKAIELIPTLETIDLGEKLNPFKDTVLSELKNP